MIVEAVTFYVFAAVAVFAGAMVVASRNPVHSVLFLVLAFINVAGLFILMGAEFLGLILVVVYVGAVAVLFMFVIMMLKLDFRELRRGFMKYAPLGAAVGIVLLSEIIIVVGGWSMAPAGGQRFAAAPTPQGITNTDALGRLLYTDYVYLFQAAGLILLVAMIGAIVLTHRSREGVRRQRIGDQLRVRKEERVEVRKVQPGRGI
jgi:NADH-quinone oxidoreductase subunit J